MSPLLNIQSPSEFSFEYFWIKCQAILWPNSNRIKRHSKTLIEVYNTPMSLVYTVDNKLQWSQPTKVRLSVWRPIGHVAPGTYETTKYNPAGSFTVTRLFIIKWDRILQLWNFIVAIALFFCDNDCELDGKATLFTSPSYISRMLCQCRLLLDAAAFHLNSNLCQVNFFCWANGGVLQHWHPAASSEWPH